MVIKDKTLKRKTKRNVYLGMYTRVNKENQRDTLNQKILLKKGGKHTKEMNRTPNLVPEIFFHKSNKPYSLWKFMYFKSILEQK